MHPRTLPDLPMAPFVPMARKKWFPKMEKKPRVEIVDDNPLSFLGDNLSYDDFDKISSSDFTPRSVIAGSMRSKSVADDARSSKGEGWRDIEKAEVMSKMTPRTQSDGHGPGTMTPGETSGAANSGGVGSKPYRGKRRGSVATTRSGSYTQRSRSSAFSKAYSDAMSEPIEEEAQEGKLTRQQELFVLYQELMEDDELGFWEIVSEVGYLNYFLFWRRGQRLKRMHHILLEYEEKVKLYNDRMRAEIAVEMGQDETALRELVKTQDAIRRKYNMKERNRRMVEVKMDRSLIKYEKKSALVQYYCDHLHDWAIEKHDEKVDQRRRELEEAEQERIKAELDRKEATRLRRVRKELSIIEDDKRITQHTLSIMRRAGMIESVNVEDLGIATKPPATRVDGEVVELRLKEHVNFEGFKKNGRFMVSEEDKAGGNDHFNPFTLDLTSNSSKVIVLQAYGIGERGAMCLAADLVRGACPFLEVLNLSHCEITTRGLSKILHGLKIAKLKSVTALDLRGNHLTPRALEYLREHLANGLLDNLMSLDLRENELGDEGAIALSRMFISGTLEHIQDLHLQQNNITDRGFLSLAKLMVHLWHQKAPNLERIGLELNKITPQAKRQIDPLPLFFSF